MSALFKNKQPMMTLAEAEIIDQNDKGINPIHFMLDYENIHQSGLKGIVYLREYDKLTIFYSDRCQTILKKDLDVIKASGCGFDVCRLVKNGKNALDFYIAARVGEELAKSNGKSMTIVVLSKDKGYESVLDYCRTRNPNCNIISEVNIEGGFLRSKANNKVKNIILEKNSTLHLNKAADIINDAVEKEKDRINKAINDKGININLDKLHMIINVNYEKSTGLYYAMIKEFGMKDGREAYQTFKEVEKSNK